MPANNPRERILREIHRRTRVVGALLVLIGIAAKKAGSCISQLRSDIKININILIGTALGSAMQFFICEPKKRQLFN